MFVAMFQVYSHLVRLGYICRRVIQKSETTGYEKQIGLDRYTRTSAAKRRIVSKEKLVAQSEALFGSDSCDQQNMSTKKPRLEDTELFDEKCSVPVKCVGETSFTHSDVTFPELISVTEPTPKPTEDITDTGQLHTRWDSITFPDIAGKTELTLHSPPKDLVPDGIDLSENEYHFNVQDMRSVRQKATREKVLEFSCGQGGWRSKVKVS